MTFDPFLDERYEDYPDAVCVECGESVEFPVGCLRGPCCETCRPREQFDPMLDHPQVTA
jgi:hypothetical protein